MQENNKVVLSQLIFKPTVPASAMREIGEIMEI